MQEKIAVSMQYPELVDVSTIQCLICPCIFDIIFFLIHREIHQFQLDVDRKGQSCNPVWMFSSDNVKKHLITGMEKQIVYRIFLTI